MFDNNMQLRRGHKSAPAQVVALLWSSVVPRLHMGDSYMPTDRVPVPAWSLESPGWALQAVACPFERKLTAHLPPRTSRLVC